MRMALKDEISSIFEISPATHLFDYTPTEIRCHDHEGSVSPFLREINLKYKAKY